MNALKVIGLLVLAFIIGLAMWGFEVWFSPYFGQGEQYRHIHDADNRTFQYEHYFTLAGNIRSESQNADAERKQLAAFNQQNPVSKDEPWNVSQQRQDIQTAITGNEQLCRANIQEYNNAVNESTRNLFLSNSLPTYFDPAAADDVTKLPSAKF